MKEGFGVGRYSWSVVSDSPAQYPERPLPGNDRNRFFWEEGGKGQGSPGEQMEPRKLLGSPCSSSEAAENFAY